MKTVYHVVRLNGLSTPAHILGIFSTMTEAEQLLHELSSNGSVGRVFIQQAWEF